MSLHHSFNDLSMEELIVQSAEAVRPAERLTVSEAAKEYRYINNPGSYVGKWKNETTPYLVEPMDTLTSREVTGMAFAGPAQTGKTDMVLNWVGYSAKCDPADMMIVQTSQTTARDFSMRRIERLHRHSPDIGELLAPTRQDDNTYDKKYKNGMLLTLSWPTINELSGKPIPRLWLTDYDRMTQDVDGEGSPFFLARKRATTFKTFGMTVAESSPGFVIDKPQWVRSTPHEAPPTEGILSIYNQGDGRLWYWKCVNWHTAFEPDFELLHYPDSRDFMEAAEMATLKCPHCGMDYHHDPMDGMPGKHQMNLSGRWIPDGMRWGDDDELHGQRIRSTIASFWLKGVAASFTDWKTLVFNYLSAEEDYAKTGSEKNLKTTINTDQGKAYVPKSMASNRVAEVLKARARNLGNRVVPETVRFLVATVDVQKNRFVVQIHGIAVNGDIYIVDRYEIKKSNRLDEDGERAWVNPGAYPEDSKLLFSEVMESSYPLADGSGRKMGILYTLTDSGGKDDSTTNAYNFYRWLKYGDPEGYEPMEGEHLWRPGMAGKFQLLKGASSRTAPRVAISYPDSQRKDRSAGARGEIPVLFINTNDAKGDLDNRLDRTDPGGRICFPNWLDDNFYIELTVEIKDPAKGWINPKRFRNESWDLLAYCLAGLLTPHIKFAHINWEEPPSWAAEWDDNSLVFEPELSDTPFAPEERKRKTLEELARDLA